MKRATISFPNDLAEAVKSFVAAQEVPPALTTVVQTALRNYLTERGFLKTRRSLQITPVRKGSGRSDGNEQHDRYLAGRQK